ncbi:SusC/RagA family TonB-linked outer membrane protein [Tellurirhabdus rosea]|uniref:SusC/RagA family TonB-linked outer membrane protein n=1 Tax=Tellurirhabdus rosea TaxID=2674997 RepID=UPI00224F1C73|nr:SusC/RagA family TonB-linked outer membrane protein [Tellurirhabdus rosea]
MKRFILTTVCCALGLLSAMAQTRFVTGKISSKDEGALPGVSVVVKDTRTGVISDATGSYKISLPDGATALVFSFIGYTTQEIAIGNRTTIDLEMLPDVRALQEVVVTAFGIEKEKKALGYTVQEVKGTQLVEARSSNVVNALSGRIAGVRVNSNGGPGSGSTVQIRGSSSISGNNQPLVVIDGVPIDQSTSQKVSDGEKQFGGGLSEISPDNIKEISVLKGPNAAALYGSRAANGVILITTKNGAGTKGLGIEYNGNMTFDRPLVKPKFQNTYGGGNGYRTWYSDGWSGVIQPDAYDQYRAAYGTITPGVTTGTDGTDESWGAPMDGRLVRQWWTGKDVAPLTPQPDNWEGYWETGKTQSHNIALSGANDKGNFRLSMGRLDQTGIMYGNDYYRNNFKLNTGYNFTPKLSVTMSAEYIKSGSDNRSFQGGDQFIWSHRHTNWEQLKDYQAYTATHIQRAVPGRLPDNDPPNWQHTFFTNPFFAQDRLPSSNEKDRLVGNIALNYKFTPSLSLLLRSGTDFWSDTRINIINFDRVRNGNRTQGQYSEEVLRSQETNSDFMFTFNKALSSVFSTTAQFGGIQRSNYYKRNFTQVNALVVDGVYNLANSIPSQNTVASRIEKAEMQSLFGTYQLAYNNAVFLDLTARNDWSSTLPSNARSYFYPSASLSAVLTDLVAVPGNTLSFAKVRASWAQVGNDAQPYQLMPTYRSGGSWDGSTPQYFENLTIPNVDLKPEITTGVELGLDVRLYKGRVGLDLTYYDQLSRNQILGVEISKASGYNSRILNAGRIANKGIEVVLTGTPLKSRNGLTWDMTVNFARNRNKVLELAEGLTTFVLQERRGLTSEARVGQPYGTLYGIGFEHAPDGQIIYKDGLPVVSTTPRVLGNVQPKWTGGFLNSLTYKGITLSALIDVRMGGSLFDEGTGTARWTGQYEETAVGREEGIIGKGVKVVKTNADGSVEYAPNDIIVATNQLIGYNNPRRYHEAAIFDASYVKLREMTIGYTIPERILPGKFIRSARVSAVGRNLAILFKNTPHIDPEVDRFGGNRQGFAYGELPSSRSIGFNLALGF